MPLLARACRQAEQPSVLVPIHNTCVPRHEYAIHKAVRHTRANIGDEVNKWKHIGGVRIEDDILITANGNDNLTIGVEKTELYN